MDGSDLKYSFFKQDEVFYALFVIWSKVRETWEVTSDLKETWDRPEPEKSWLSALDKLVPDRQMDDTQTFDSLSSFILSMSRTGSVKFHAFGIHQLLW